MSGDPFLTRVMTIFIKTYICVKVREGKEGRKEGREEGRKEGRKGGREEGRKGAVWREMVCPILIGGELAGVDAYI